MHISRIQGKGYTSLLAIIANRHYISSMKKLVLVLLMLVNITVVYGQFKQVAAVRGKVYIKIGQLAAFKGYRELESVTLEPSDENYTLTLMAKGANQVLVLSRCMHNNAHVSYKLLDAVALGRVAPDQAVITAACGMNNKGDNNIIALVKADNKPFYKVVFKAWRVNRNAGRIQAISTKGIDCLNQGFDM